MDSSARKWAAAAILCSLFSVGHAADVTEFVPGLVSNDAARTNVYEIAITRGPLARVLEQFSRQTGIQTITQLSVSESTTEEFGPFQGAATADRSMRELLGGTDLWYACQDDSTVTLFRVSSQRTSWSTGVATAKEASDSIEDLSGIHYETGPCSDVLVGPYEADQPISAEEFWITLVAPHCKVVRQQLGDLEPGSIDRVTVLGKTTHQFSIPEMPRASAINTISTQAGDVPLSYISSDAAEERELVGPVEGRMTLDEALQTIMRGTPLRVRWVDDDRIASIEPAYQMVAYALMPQCPRGCNFGFPELWPLESRQVTVEKSRLPSLEEMVSSPVFVGDREWIDRTGATTIPELLEKIPQIAFHRGAGYRLSGAQFFEGGRGLDARYTLVLVNGHRAFGSAADPMTSAFDLNNIPLPAVQRIEISFDQPPLVNGTDAIGGTVNIVLKDSTDGIGVDALIGSAEGGAVQRRGTLSGGHDFGEVQGGIVLDYFSTGELLGEDRDRWRNQDYRRFGGTDQRSRFAAPPNVRSMFGNLPGLTSSAAAIVPGGDTPHVDTTIQNLTSLRAWQAIVPASERVSLYGFANAAVGTDSTLRVETLLGRHHVDYQLMPTIIPGFVWGASHSENPFDQDVMIETALTGFPSQGYDTDSDLARGVAEFTSTADDWSINIFGLMQRDSSRIQHRNGMDMLAIMGALTASNDLILPVASERPGQGADPRQFMAPHSTEELVTDAQQFGASVSGTLLRAVSLTTEIGIEHRRESMEFDPQVGTVSRDLDAAFVQFQIPLFEKRFELSAGARHDRHSDLDSVTRPTYAVTWRPTTNLSIVASASRLYRPPSLFELRRPRIATPTQIWDPVRNELSPVTIIFGGNAELDATDGESSSLSLTWHTNTWRAVANMWQLELQARLSAPSAPILLTTDGWLAQDRIRRDPATGRLVSIDLSYANFGEALTRGLDISIEHEANTEIGLFRVRLDLTHTFSFEYSDLPIANAPLMDRVGQAALEGTVPDERAVLQVDYSHGNWTSTLFARYRSAVDDYSVVTNSPLYREISSQILFDAQVSRTVGDRVELTLGVNNMLDDQPPFAAGFNDLGFDQGQGDLLGRSTYLKVGASF